MRIILDFASQERSNSVSILVLPSLLVLGQILNFTVENLSAYVPSLRALSMKCYTHLGEAVAWQTSDAQAVEVCQKSNSPCSRSE